MNEFVAGLKRWYRNYSLMLLLAFFSFLIIARMGMVLPRAYLIGILLSPIAFWVADAINYHYQKGILFRTGMALLMGFPLLLLIPIGQQLNYWSSGTITGIDVYWFLISYLAYSFAISFGLLIYDGFNLEEKVSERASIYILVIIVVLFVFSTTYAVASINEWGDIGRYF